MKTSVVHVLALALALVVAAYGAADSPQFRGPDRDGKFPADNLLKSWPEGGPELAWKTDGLGTGYASPAIVDDRIYVPGILEDFEAYVFVLDLEGNIKNKMGYGKETEDRWAPGPRSTPTIDGNRLYIMSGLGVLTCLNRDDGSKLWSVNVLERFDGKMITWTLAESVLIDGDKVICTPGGPDASVAALDKMTGETIWTTKGFDEPSAYCSADLINHNGHPLIVTMTAKSVVGIDPATGEVLWKHRHETDHDIHAVTPVYADGMLYYTAGYKSGGGMLKLSEDGKSVTPVWQDKTLDVQHHGVVLHDGYVYGTTHQAGRKMVCLELKTGKVMWETKEIGQGNVIFADGMLYVYEGPQRGIVSLVKATPEGFERTGTFELPKGSKEHKHWTHPAIDNGKLYIRWAESLMAYDISAE